MKQILFFGIKSGITSFVDELVLKEGCLLRKIERNVFYLEKQKDNELHEFHLYHFEQAIQALKYLKKYYYNLIVIDFRASECGNQHETCTPTGQTHCVPTHFLKILTQEADPDERYPRNRIIAILSDDENLPEAAFRLGKYHIGGFITLPSRNGSFSSLAINIMSRKQAKPKLAICLGGGGFEGLLYQLGVLRALDSFMANFRVTDFDMYYGISAGGILAAALANGVLPHEMQKMFDRKSGDFPKFNSKIMFSFNYYEYLKSVFKFLGGFTRAKTYGTFVSHILKCVPTGYFDGDKLEKYFEKMFTFRNLKNDFRDLKKELYIGSTDQDTGEHVIFGDSGWDHIPISMALRASTALVPFYGPKKIEDHWFIDGGFTRTTNFEAAVKNGASLVLIVDPLVPIHSKERGYVVKKGGFFMSIQGLKAMSYSRFQLKYNAISGVYSDVDFYVSTPDEITAKIMSGSPMRYGIRMEIERSAFFATVRRILDNFQIIKENFQKYGIILTDECVLEEERLLKQGNNKSVEEVLAHPIRHNNNKIHDAMSNLNKLEKFLDQMSTEKSAPK